MLVQFHSFFSLIVYFLYTFQIFTTFLCYARHLTVDLSPVSRPDTCIILPTLFAFVLCAPPRHDILHPAQGAPVTALCVPTLIYVSFRLKAAHHTRVHTFPRPPASPQDPCTSTPPPCPHCIATLYLYHFVNRHLWHAHRQVACLSHVSSPMTLTSSGMFLFNCPLIE